MILTGIALFGFTLFQLYIGSGPDPLTEVPGKVTAEIKEPGRYYLWDNHWTTFEGERKKYAADCPEDAEISVKGSDGKELTFVPDRSQNWSIGNSEKTSIGYVDVASASELEFTVGDVNRPRIVSVSKRSMKQDLWLRLAGTGIGAVVGILGIPVIILGFIQQRSSRKE